MNDYDCDFYEKLETDEKAEDALDAFIDALKETLPSEAYETVSVAVSDAMKSLPLHKLTQKFDLRED